MYWLKGCKKCGGDLFLERDRYGSYVSCLQCGAVRLDLDDSNPVGAVGAMLKRRGQDRHAA